MSGYLPVRKGSVRQVVQTDSQEDRMLNDHPPPKKTPLVLDQGLADGQCAAQTGAGCQSWPGAAAQSSSQVRSCGCSEAYYEKVNPRCCRSQRGTSE